MLTAQQIKQAKIAKEAMLMIESGYPTAIPSHVSDYYDSITRGMLTAIKANDKQKVRELADPYLTSRPFIEALDDITTSRSPQTFYSEMFRQFVTSLTPIEFRIDLVAANPNFDQPKEYLARGLLKVVK